MVNFIYTPTAEDYIAFEKFKYKKNKTFFISYVFCAMFIAIALYEFFIDKNYSMLVCAVLFTVINFSFFLYTSKTQIKKNIRNMISKDVNYLTPNEIIIDDKTIEIKNIPQPNQIGIVAVYPYSIMNVIYETEECYFFFLGTEVKILPKRAIPQENKEYVEKVIRNNKNYMFVK